MKLTEALKVLQAASGSDSPAFPVLLACGFTPLHLQTFLAAHLQSALPGHHVTVQTGLYGDLDGSLAGAGSGGPSAVVAPIEWPDIDPRLGWRQLGGWGPAELKDIGADAAARLDRIRDRIETVAEKRQVAVSLPTLPLPPVGFTPRGQAGAFELEIREAIARFSAALARCSNVRMVSAAALDEISPSSERFDFKSELLTGFPYKQPHADKLAELLAGVLAPPSPKKGLITDLDDTLWCGLVGEVGAENICWDLERHAQIHGLYQQVLKALADQGALIGVASKNDPRVVEEALRRSDLLLPADRVFPIEVHWNRKSESIARILRAWNIAADSVVFVDDSPMELAEVATAYPDIECILFPKQDYAAAYDIFRRLRDLFGKPFLSSEDALRSASLRAGGEFQEELSRADDDPDRFLAQADAVLEVRVAKDAGDRRAFELINKTNQFNLNGVRLTEQEWRSHLDRPGSFVFTVGYQDKYGALGKIAVIAGEAGNECRVGAWVMSCRAFARRIEHKCLELLFDRLDAPAIRFDFQPTTRNGPFRDFLDVYTDGITKPDASISHERFLEKCPTLFHRVMIVSD